MSITAYRVGINDKGFAIGGTMHGKVVKTVSFGIDVNDFTYQACFVGYLQICDYYSHRGDAREFYAHVNNEGLLKKRMEGKKLIIEYTDKELGFSYRKDEDYDDLQDRLGFDTLHHVVEFDVIREHFKGIGKEDRDAIMNL